MIRGAIFDVDGTLLDSMPIWNEAGARYLGKLGILPEPGLAQTLFPLSFEEGAAYLNEHYSLGKSVSSVMQGISDIIEDFYRYEVSPKPGAAAFLQELRKQNIPMVLATTGDPLLAGAAFRRLGMADCFLRPFTCEELHTTKRQPDIYLAAAAYLGTLPSETAVFEDMLHAVRTAADAGFVTVAVEDRESEKDRAAIRDAASCYLKDFTESDIFWQFAADL